MEQKKGTECANSPTSKPSEFKCTVTQGRSVSTRCERERRGMRKIVPNQGRGMGSRRQKMPKPAGSVRENCGRTPSGGESRCRKAHRKDEPLPLSTLLQKGLCIKVRATRKKQALIAATAGGKEGLQTTRKTSGGGRRRVRGIMKLT